MNFIFFYFPVPTKLFNKITLFHHKHRKRSVSLSGDEIMENKTEEKDIDRSKSQDNSSKDISRVKIKTLEFNLDGINDSSSDLVVPCGRFSEVFGILTFQF